MSEKPTMIFVDAQNLIHGAEDYYEQKKQLDPVKLADVLAEDYDLIRPYWFDSHPDGNYPQSFYHFLRMEGGYRVTSKPLRQRGERKIEKGVDIDMATEIIAQGFNDSYETAIVVTGDADFKRAIRYVQDQGKRVIGAAFSSSASGELKGTVDDFVDLKDYAAQIRRDD